VRAVLDRFKREPGLALLAAALVLAIALYAPTLGRGLTNYDEPWLVRDNWILQHPSLASLKTIFFELDVTHRFSLAPEYLPVRDLSVMADFAIWGTWWPGHHLVNLLLYLGAIAIWFAAFEAFGVKRTIAGLAVLVWSVHPAHAESVAWVAERKGLLGVVFAGICTLGYARWRAGRSARWLALATACAVCAVWSKALAAFAVAGIAGLELALPELRVSWRRSLVGLAVIGGAAALAFVPVLLLASSAAVVGSESHAPAGRFAMVLGVHGFYLRLATMTMANAISYPLTTHGPTAVDEILGVAGLVAVGFALVRGSPLLRAAAVLWLFGWLPVSHLILPPQMIMVADRYLLIPSIGLALAVATGLSLLPRGRIAVGAVLVIAAALRTLDAQSSWENPQELWARAVDSNPDDTEAWSMYAEALASAGQNDLADAAVEAGLRHGDAPELLVRKALFAMGRGDRAGARELFLRAANAGNMKAMSNLALILEGDGKLDEAYVWAQKAVATSPIYAHAQRTLGKIALERHDDAVAITAFERALDLEPTNLANQFNLGLALLEARRGAEAISHFEACAADPQVGARCRQAIATARSQ
jgi:Tfp pilus assembly protein PilF